MEPCWWKQRRTWDLVLWPTAALVSATLMTAFNDSPTRFTFGSTTLHRVFSDYDSYMHKVSIEPNRDSWDSFEGGGRGGFLISLLMNYRDIEFWPMWLFRWLVFSKAFMTIRSFKLDCMPATATYKRMLVDFYFWVSLVCLLSGFRQLYPSKESYAVYGPTFGGVHELSAFVLFGLNIAEVFTVWLDHGHYGAQLKWFVMFYLGAFLTFSVVTKVEFMRQWVGWLDGLNPSRDTTINHLEEHLGADVFTFLIGMTLFEYINFIAYLYCVWKNAPLCHPGELAVRDVPSAKKIE